MGIWVTLDKSVGHRRTARRDSQLFTPTSKENLALPNVKEARAPGENPHRYWENMKTLFAKAKHPMSLQLIRNRKQSLARRQEAACPTLSGDSKNSASPLIWIMNLPLPLPQHVFSLIIKSCHGCKTTAVLLGHYHTCNLCQNWKVSKRQVNAGGPGWSPERQTPTPEQSDREIAATFTLHPSQTQNPGCQRGKEGRWPQCYTPARILCSKLCVIQECSFIFNTGWL